MQGDRALWCYSVQRSYASEREASIGHGGVPALICFSSNLHVTGFSSCRITTMIHSYLVWFLWWLRHGAIGPANWGNPIWGECRLNWQPNLHIFNLVIRLSKVQQLALPFCGFDDVLRLLWSQGFLAAMPVYQSEAVWNCQKPRFYCSSCFHSDRLTRTGFEQQAGTRLSGVVFFLLMVVWWGETYCAPNSLELESRLCQLGQDLTTVPERE